MNDLQDATARSNLRFSDPDWIRLMDSGVHPRWKATPRAWLAWRSALALLANGIVVYSLAYTSGFVQLDCHRERSRLQFLFE